MTELHFKGKEFVYNHHLAVPFRPLQPDAGRSVGEARLDGNLIVHGDNLHALKALLPLYAGQVDCIFIDPPYNTGNEGWCYNDNVNSPLLKQWLQGNPIGIEDGLRHDKWCAMMYPRLRLLHELLAETGSFWMTLDDNEVHRARSMLDEIFTEENFVANVVWNHTKQSKNDERYFSRHHNQILVYRKTSQLAGFGFDRSEKDNVNYSNQDGDPKGDWRPGDVRSPNYRATLRYAIEAPNGTQLEPPENGWRWSQETLLKKLESGEITFSEDQTRILRKIYLSDQGERTPENLWLAEAAGATREANAELKDIFGGEKVFDTPKPTRLIERILELVDDPGAVVLDSFAGSGTTAHAVLAQNAKDGGQRKFILVEGEDYADALTAERVRRVINGYDFAGTQREELLRESITWSAFSRDNARDRLLHHVKSIENLDGPRFDRIKKTVKGGELIVTGEKDVTQRTEGLGGSFTYCTLGPAIELDALLTGESLPAFEALGSVLFHMATNAPFDAARLDMHADGVGLLGSAAGMFVWLIYKPELDWLKSKDAALTLERAKQFAAHDANARHLVFAPARFVSQKLLDSEGLKVEFAPLPYALYRIERA